MKTLYSMLLYFTQLELAIARSTGRNPANVEQLQREESKWAHALLMKELNT